MPKGKPSKGTPKDKRLKRNKKRKWHPVARLRAKKRNKLRKGSFALPSKRKYPIHDKAHAKQALRMAARKDTVGSYSTVSRAVFKKYPSLKKSKRWRTGCGRLSASW
jgi:hypothetical protein